MRWYARLFGTHTGSVDQRSAGEPIIIVVIMPLFMVLPSWYSDSSRSSIDECTLSVQCNFTACCVADSDASSLTTIL